MKNATLIKDKKRSWRLRIFFIIFFSAIFYYLFFPKPEAKNNTSPEFFIPAEHQEKRFDYLSYSDANFFSENGSQYYSINLKNDSYIYDLKNIYIKLSYFSDKENKNKINEDYLEKIEVIPSKENYLIKKEIISGLPNKYWVAISIDQLELSKKEN